MELRLKNGRYVPDRHQGFGRVSQTDELAQRLTMKLTARRGEFLPLPDYGSRLYTLHKLKPSQRETAARQFIIEAIADEPEVELVDFSCEQKALTAELSMVFAYKGDERFVITTEV